MAIQNNYQNGGPPPTFQSNTPNQVNNNQGNNQNPSFSGTDKFTVDKTANSFDNALSQMGAKVGIKFDTPNTNQQTNPTNNGAGATGLAALNADEQKFLAQVQQKINANQGKPVDQVLTQQEIAITQQLMAKVEGGSPTTPNQQTANTNATQPQIPSTVTKEELQWALSLEEKQKAGQPVTAQEKAAYEDISKRLQEGLAQQQGVGTNPTTATVSQDEINWALALEAKHKAGEPVSQDDLAKYNDIGNRIKLSMQNGNTAPQKDWQSWSEPFSVPRQFFQSSAQVFEVPTTLRQAAPTGGLPSHASVNATNNLNVPYQQTQQNPNMNYNQYQQTANALPISDQEKNWALGLEAKVKTGYVPNESELYQYKQIADKLQAFAAQQQNNQGQVNPNAQNQGNPNNQGQTNPDAEGSSFWSKVKNAWGELTK